MTVDPRDPAAFIPGAADSGSFPRARQVTLPEHAFDREAPTLRPPPDAMKGGVPCDPQAAGTLAAAPATPTNQPGADRRMQVLDRLMLVALARLSPERQRLAIRLVEHLSQLELDDVEAFERMARRLARRRVER